MLDVDAALAVRWSSHGPPLRAGVAGVREHRQPVDARPAGGDISKALTLGGVIGGQPVRRRHVGATGDCRQGCQRANRATTGDAPGWLIAARANLGAAGLI